MWIFAGVCIGVWKQKNLSDTKVCSFSLRGLQTEGGHSTSQVTFVSFMLMCIFLKTKIYQKKIFSKTLILFYIFYIKNILLLFCTVNK